jgi:hypothetical protein
VGFSFLQKWGIDWLENWRIYSRIAYSWKGNLLGSILSFTESRSGKEGLVGVMIANHAPVNS